MNYLVMINSKMFKVLEIDLNEYLPLFSKGLLWEWEHLRTFKSVSLGALRLQNRVRNEKLFKKCVAMVNLKYESDCDFMYILEAKNRDEAKEKGHTLKVLDTIEDLILNQIQTCTIEKEVEAFRNFYFTRG